MQGVAHLMAAMCLAAAGLILGGTLVLPSFAGHQLQDNLSKAIQGVGRRLSRSRYEPHILGCST